MTREQIEQEYRKLMKERIEEGEKIMKQAKENGTWEPGLDGNHELFKDISDRYKKRIQELKDSLDE